MSDHIMEDLIEASIRVLHARHPNGDPRVRDSIAALYAFQSDYDCSFTHFRVMDELLTQRYTYRFDPREHPDHAELREFFDGLTEFTALAPEPDGDDEDYYEQLDAWLDLGYADPPYLYCDAGTTLWRRMVAAGALTGRDAEPPRRSALSAVVHDVVVGARDDGDIELIALWHARGGDSLLAEAATEDAAKVRAVRAVREIAVDTGAVTHELYDGVRPPPEFFGDGGELGAWWSGEDGYDDVLPEP